MLREIAAEVVDSLMGLVCPNMPNLGYLSTVSDDEAEICLNVAELCVDNLGRVI